MTQRSSVCIWEKVFRSCKSIEFFFVCKKIMFQQQRLQRLIFGKFVISAENKKSNYDGTLSGCGLKWDS